MAGNLFYYKDRLQMNPIAKFPAVAGEFVATGKKLATAVFVYHNPP